MSSRKWVSFVGCITPIILLLAACSEPESKTPDNWTGVCIDSDGDGFGFQCSAGADCNDADPAVHEGCGRCDTPSEGCACEEDSKPLACSLPLELTETGALLCRDGTRYCRDRVWTECEGIRSYEAPPPSDVPAVKLLGLGPADGGAGRCNACRPDCYDVGDAIGGGLDGGSSSNDNVTLRDGGITLISAPRDAGVPDTGFLDDYECIVGVPPDKDCDGIPDMYDEFEGAPPFQTDHKTIFMDLGPGESREQNLKVDFSLASADIYFYLDMTSSMEEERDNLIDSLITGNYLPSAGVGLDCADRDYDGTPDNYLKTQGVSGNIACLIRDARFGAGWFRDVPFNSYGGFDYPDSFAMYEHRLDMTDNVEALRQSLTGFDTAGGLDGEEGSIQGLYAIATGNEIYPGWDRPGVPARRDCPANRWGYPCFRRGSVPIIIHVTDQGLHNGPPTSVGGTNYKYPYGSSNFSSQKRGTAGTFGAESRYLYPMSAAAEHFGNAQDYGVIDNKFVTYAGNTETMASDLTYTTAGTCGSGSAWDSGNQSGKDAVFKFTVGSYTNGSTTSGTRRTIKLSTRGSRFDTTLMLRSSAPSFMPLVASDNGSFASAYNLGNLAAGQRVVVGGDTSAHESVYAREGLTSSSGCFVDRNASDLAPASVMKFRLASDMNVRVTTVSASGANTALLVGSAREPTRVVNMGAMDCGSGSQSNCNDSVGDYSIGNITGGYVHLTGGNTGASGLTSNYTAEFNTCSGATYASSRDTVVDFKVTQSTPVRIETTGSNNSMSASFAHGLSLIRKSTASASTTKPVPNGNGTQAAAFAIAESDVPSDGTFVRFEGNSASDSATYSQAEVGGTASNVCGNGEVGAPSDRKDVVFRFNVTTTRSYEFDTAPSNAASGYKTWLSLHRGEIGRATTLAVSNAAELDAAQGQSVATGAQGPIDNRRVLLTSGRIDLRDRTYTPSTMGANCGSTGNGSSYGGRDAVFKFRATTSSPVTIRTVGSDGTGVPAFDSYLAVFKGSISSGNRVSGDCPTPTFWNRNANNQSGNGWTKTITTEANTDYYVVVKEWLFNTAPSAASGAFGLVIEDSRYASTFVGCDAGSSPTSDNFSRLTASLTPGTYYLVLKGTGASPNTNYALNVRRSIGSGTAGAVVACANSSSDRAAIEQTLEPGDYALIVKGQRTSSCSWWSCNNVDQNGSYDLTIRDLSVAPNPSGCQNTGSSGGSFVVNNLKRNNSSGQPIDYYLVTRGNTAGGSYQVIVEDAAAAAVGDANACADNISSSNKNSELSVQLAPGTYYAVVKGKSGTQQGHFQLSVGEDKSNVTSTGTFSPQTWQGANQVRQALMENEIRVIPVNAIHSATSNTAAFTVGTDGYNQTLVLGKETGGLASSATRAYEIGTDGSGMGNSVIQAVSDIAKNLSMDLGLHLIDNPGFRMRIEALAGSGNCSPPIDTTADGVVDTHVACRPGATPKFKITFTNPPAPGNVPSNASDPQGGYHMRLQLIGDRKYVVDEIPVYIIPEDVVPSQNPELYAVSGTYEEKIAAQCSGTDTPMWRSLSWSAKVPAGTSMVWRACTGRSEAELATCSLQTAATVTSGAACASSAQCPQGYCGSSGVCEYAVGPACSDDAECGEDGLCFQSRCRWTKNPIDLLPALRNGHQGKEHMRVSVTLNASEDLLRAPSVSNWNLNYFCRAGL